jgi:hypothetical protein
MKNVIAFATISACVLVLSGGAALAGQPGHNPATGAGANCATAANSAPSDGAAEATGSPFNTTTGGVAGGHYAGSTLPLSSPHAFSNYDIACVKAQVPQVP